MTPTTTEITPTCHHHWGCTGERLRLSIQVGGDVYRHPCACWLAVFVGACAAQVAQKGEGR